MAVQMTVSVKHTGYGLTPDGKKTAQATITAYVTTSGQSYNNGSVPGTFTIRAPIGTLVGGNASGEITGSFSHSIPQNSTTVIWTRTVSVQYNSSGQASVYCLVTFNTGISAGNLRRATTQRFPDTVAGTTGSLSVVGLSNDGQNFLGVPYEVQITAPDFGEGKSYDYSAVVESFGSMPTGGRTIGSGSLTEGGTTTIAWTPAVSQYEPYMSGEAEDCTVRCVFYSSSGVAFQTHRKTFPLMLPGDYAPEISGVQITDSTGNLESSGVVVPGISVLTVSCTVAPQGAASIASVRLQLGGNAYAMTNTSGNTWSVSGVTTYGGADGYIRATDSRGLNSVEYISEGTGTIQAPLIEASAYRYSTSTGEEDDESSIIRVNVSATVYQLGSGATGGTLKIGYRVLGSTTDFTTYATQTFSGSTYSTYRNISGRSVSQGWEILVSVTGGNGATSDMTLVVGTATPIFDFTEDSSVAMWGLTDREGLNVFKSLTIFGVGNGLWFKGNRSASDSDAKQVFKIIDDPNVAGDYTDVIMPRVLKSDGLTLTNSTGTIQEEAVSWDDAYNYPALRGSVLDLLGSSPQINWDSDGGPRGSVWRQLWSGTWSSGQTTAISDLPQYNLLVLVLSNGQRLPVWRHPRYPNQAYSWGGTGGAVGSSSSAYLLVSWLTGNATRLQPNGGTAPVYSINLTTSGDVASITAQSVVSIWGVL